MSMIAILLGQQQFAPKGIVSTWRHSMDGLHRFIFPDGFDPPPTDKGAKLRATKNDAAYPVDRVLYAIEQGAKTQQDIVRRSGLSPSCVSDNLKKLIADGRVIRSCDTFPRIHTLASKAK